MTVHDESEDGRPSSLPKDPQNIAESGEVQRQKETEAPREEGGRGEAVLVAEMEQSLIPTPHPTLAASPSAASTAGFHKHHSPHKPVPTPPPYPWTQAIHPNTGGKTKLFKVNIFSVSPAPDRGAC